MSYQQRNSRQPDHARQGKRPVDGNPGESKSYAEANAQRGNYEESSYGASSEPFPYDAGAYENRNSWGENNEFSQNQRYDAPPNFRGNRDYRSTQEDYRTQQDYEIGNPSEREAGAGQRYQPQPQPHPQQNWSQYPQQPSPSGSDYSGYGASDYAYGAESNYRSAQFAGRQQIPGSQRPRGQHPRNNYGSDFGNARRQYAGDEAGSGRHQSRGSSYPSQGLGFDGYRGGYRQPQSANNGWQDSSSRHSTDYFDTDLYDGELDGAGGYYVGNPSFQDRSYRANTQGYNQSQSHRGRAPKGYERSDERIREDVCERLTHDHRVDASDISVTVKAGVVTLEGSIGDRAQKYRAEDISDDVSGVKDVQNRLNVVRHNQNNTPDKERADSDVSFQLNQDDLDTQSSKVTRQ